MAPAATLLFCHGTSFCKEIWSPIIQRVQRAPLLRRATAGVDIVTFNYPYHGEKRDVSQPATLFLDDPTSPRVHHEAMDWSKWSIPEVQRQVRLLQDKAGSARTPLIGIGHSMGAASLWATEAANPGTFDGLVLFEPMVNGDDYPNRKKSVDFLVSVTLQRRFQW
jgi:pimeloyl-ACP methyl ester carboxylesterase